MRPCSFQTSLKIISRFDCLPKFTNLAQLNFEVKKQLLCDNYTIVTNHINQSYNRDPRKRLIQRTLQE